MLHLNGRTYGSKATDANIVWGSSDGDWENSNPYHGPVYLYKLVRQQVALKLNETLRIYCIQQCLVSWVSTR